MDPFLSVSSFSRTLFDLIGVVCVFSLISALLRLMPG